MLRLSGSNLDADSEISRRNIPGHARKHDRKLAEFFQFLAANVARFQVLTDLDALFNTRAADHCVIEIARQFGSYCVALHWTPLPVELAREHRESDARQEAAPEFLSARGAREGCGTSPCRHCIPELPRLPHNSGLRGRAKSPRCETPRESAAKRRGPPLEFPARQVARKVLRRDPRLRCVHALLPVGRRWKHSSANG